LLGQAWRNSQILSAKFESLRYAFIFLALSVGPWVIALMGFASHTQTPLEFPEHPSYDSGIEQDSYGNQVGLKDELSSEIEAIYRDAWTTRDGYVVPTDTSVTMSNDAVKIEGAVLYADIADSTKMVQERPDFGAAEIYKAFLRCSARIILAEGGSVTAYDGDRVMGVFVGNSKETTAVRAALKINWAVKNIVVPLRNKVYSKTTISLGHVVGVDASPLFIAKTGVRGSNDLVWVGRAANHAAKLAALPHGRSTYITHPVYMAMDASVTWLNGTDMWTPLTWNDFDGSIIYGSTYWWSLG
jgi:class 3 adenylate cyclase